MKNVLKWSSLHSLKTNLRKFQFMILDDYTCYEHVLKISLICVQSSDDITLLGVIIDKIFNSQKAYS